MFSFEDSIDAGVLRHPDDAHAPSVTPIYDSLVGEWQRMYRAVPGDRRFESHMPPAQVAPPVQYQVPQQALPQTPPGGVPAVPPPPVRRPAHLTLVIPPSRGDALPL